METGLKGKTVLVTGASRNMGRMAALAFAREGANVALCTSQKMKELNAVADEARAFGVKALSVQCDVSDGAAVADFVKQAEKEFGGVDVAVNLAGYRCEGKLLDVTMEGWNKAIAVNLTGPFYICRAVLPLMKERKWGRIINISGVSPFIGSDPAKAMVKFGIVGFTRGLAREFGEFNITANCIGPGAIGREAKDAHERDKTVIPGQPLRRKGRPEEVTSMMTYLASEDAGFITGQCYLVNGGAYFS